MEYDNAELSVLLTTDQEIAELNKNYRSKVGPTDVLSFSQVEGEGIAGSHLGDLVISLETCERQAVEFEVTYEQELHRLMVHGLLHLLGYEHENVTEEEAERMRQKEEELLESIR